MKEITDANFPKDVNGAPYHLQTTNVSSKVLTVGDLTRAKQISTLLTQVEEFSSTRGFTTINGLYKNVKVSIISIGNFSLVLFIITELLCLYLLLVVVVLMAHALKRGACLG
jgi:hypothetical protein